MAKGKARQQGRSERKKTNGSSKHKAAASKPSAEKLSDDQRRDLLFLHVGKVKPLIAAVEATQANLKKAYELAKNDGIPKKDIELAISFETDEGNEKQTAEVERIMRVARWAGAKLGTQLDLFGKPEKVDPIYQDGYRAAMANESAKPPAHHPQKAAQRWLEGHADGRRRRHEMIAEHTGNGMGTLGEAAERVAEKAKETIGTVPPTHSDARQATAH